jgi:hypothetical protein
MVVNLKKGQPPGDEEPGVKPCLGLPVLFTDPGGKTYAGWIGGVREHGGCDLYILKPGDAYWEPNSRQGDGPNTWRPNLGGE